MSASAEIDVAVSFLTALFRPGDTVVFRPIETWSEGDKKNSEVDHHGIVYHTLGGRVGSEWVDYPRLSEIVVERIIARAASQRSNIFYGVCPRWRPGSDSASYEQAWQIRTVRCLWSDIDDADVQQSLARCSRASLPEPSIAVASGHGAHLYWLLDEAVSIDDAGEPPAVHTEFFDQGQGKKKRRRLYYCNGSPQEKNYLDVPTHKPSLSPRAVAVQDTLTGIAAAIGGDHTFDLARLLRLPGTLNRKNERNGKTPVPCSLVVCEPGRRYPFAIFDTFEKQSPQRRDREGIAKIPLPRPKKIGGRGQDRLDALISDCIAADQGARSEADFALCCWAVEQGQLPDVIWQAVSGAGKFAEAGRRYFDLTWAAACGHTREKRYTKARAKATKKTEAKEKSEHQEGKDGLSHPVDERSFIEADNDPHRLARVNLDRYATNNAGRTLRYWRDEWYVWKENRYRKITKDELRAKVVASIREEFERIANEKALAGESDDSTAVATVSLALVSNVLQATSGMVCVSASVEPGSWLPTRERRNWVSMTNGILDIDAVLAHSDNPAEYLKPNSPEWFSTISLPYAFDPNATCPRFDDFLEHNLEMDPERIKILQEWAGYLLLPDTGEQRFMVLEGEGANGKSVFIAALTAMLGPENVANVPLEKFGDRFSLTTTLGKLLNAAGDCGDLDKSAEGELKSFTGGDRMFFDRKGIAGLECTPTARLMIACNNRPRLADRSNGVWRRMLLIPWRVEIERERRVRGMDKVEWWQKSGELSGIFCWALDGLARLRAQGGFTDSEVMAEALRDYQEEMNPARVFLQNYCELDGDSSIRSAVVYKFYRKWAEENGYYPLSERVFGREIRRVFRKIDRRQKNDGGSKIWYYSGLKFSQDEICGEKVDQYKIF